MKTKTIAFMGLGLMGTEIDKAIGRGAVEVASTCQLGNQTNLFSPKLTMFFAKNR